MLIPDEMHNWLPFMDLSAADEAAWSRTRVLGGEASEAAFFVPQAFPQAGQAKVACGANPSFQNS